MSKWSDAPIFYMIAQVRFGPVLNMPDYIASIQAKLRHQFPDFMEDKLQQIEFRGTAGEVPELKTSQTPRWHFRNLHQRSGYMLKQDSLSFHTTDYDTSEQFFDALVTGLRILNDDVGISYVEGMGIRSLDAVVPSGNRSLSFYLKPGFLGFDNALSEGFRHSIFECLVQKPNQQLISRAVTVHGNLALSADLLPFTLQVPERLQNLQTHHVVLDNDCSMHQRMEFDETIVHQRIKSLKKAITDAFNDSVTTEAVRLWKGEA